MTVDPSGYPVWTRTSDYTVYGGDPNKANYQSQGAINPRTDVTAEQFSRLVEDLAECARTSAFALMRITCNDSSPAAPTIEWARLNTGVRSSSYAGDSAPTGFPSGARVSNGAALITFDASYDDAFGVAASLELVHVVASPIFPCAYVTWSLSSNVITLRGFDSTGAALVDAQYSVEIAS